MTDRKYLHKIKSEIQKGMRLAKCRKCGCMKETLENLLTFLSSIKSKESSGGLIQNVNVWLKEMQPIEYTCRWCKYCFPAVVINFLTEKFPPLTKSLSLTCDFEVRKDTYPPVAGEYFLVCRDSTCPVAVSTLASIELAENIANMRPNGLCIIGKTETENIGIDKIIKNTITNPPIRFLIVAGQDPKGHYSGKTLLALSEKGIDKDMRIIDAPGRYPILRNVSPSEVELFRKQVQVISMIGCQDAKKITDKIDELSKKTISTCECKECPEPVSSVHISTAPKIVAREPKKLKMDKGGYFVIIPSIEKKFITVEHYAYNNKLLHTIEGKDAPSIYSTIIENGWITELSHTAYLGRELAKAEFALKYKIKYIQDKAPGVDERKTR